MTEEKDAAQQPANTSETFLRMMEDAITKDAAEESSVLSYVPIDPGDSDRVESRRPDIGHLRDAVSVFITDGVSAAVPLFDVGDRIVVDVCTSLLPGNPWLHTVVGEVLSMDHEKGIVSMKDEASENNTVRWVSFRSGLSTFKQIPTKGPIFMPASGSVACPEAQPAPVQVNEREVVIASPTLVKERLQRGRPRKPKA